MPEILFPILWVEQHVLPSPQIFEELGIVRSFLDWGGVVCAVIALFIGTVVVIAICATICAKKSQQYAPPPDLVKPEKPKDEAEMKLYAK